MISPSKALNKAYQKVAVEEEHFKKFLEELKRLLSYDEKATEETQKTNFANFLRYTFYASNYVNSKNNIDLVIHLGKKDSDKIGVIFEVKSISNRSEMVTTSNLNKKAMQELLYYYLQERITHKNSDLKYLVMRLLQKSTVSQSCSQDCPDFAERMKRKALRVRSEGSIPPYVTEAESRK